MEIVFKESKKGITADRHYRVLDSYFSEEIKQTVYIFKCDIGYHVFVSDSDIDNDNISLINGNIK